MLPADLVSQEHSDGASTLIEFPDIAASRLGSERQKHKPCLGRYFAPVTHDLRVTEPEQSHDRLLQKRHLPDQNRRSFRTFRQLLLQFLI